MAFDSTRNVAVLFGGAGLGVFSDTWEWNGTSWSQRAPAHSPQERWGHAMAFDSARGKVVLFGGEDGTNRYSDTWEWDGSDWSLVNPPNRPTARDGHAMAYDSTRQRVVLFGGWTTLPQDDTWEFNGTDWTQVAFSARPTARQDHSLAFDGARNRMVLFGGYGPNVTFPADTWELNATASSWTRVNGPAPESMGDLAYDSVRQRVMCFGSSEAAGSQGTVFTQEWNGTSWAGRSPAQSPTLRNGHTLVYDSARQQLVLFGGSPPLGGPAVGDLWVY